jgi:putative membrane protein
MHLLLRWLVNTLALLAVAYLVRGFSFDSFGAAAITALVLGLLNALVRPLLVLLTFPITVLTLGLFLIVLNAVMLELADWMIAGFHIRDFWSAMLGALLLSIIGIVTNRIGREKRRSD